MTISPSISLRPALALLAAAAPAVAQTPISGVVSDATTGPLLTGVVYHAGNLSVPAGATLTVQPGAIVKFSAAAQFQVHGRLDVLGAPGQPAILTDVRDDGAGGDTNGDGAATAPAAGWWQGMMFEAGATGDVRRLEVRYAGRTSGAFLLRNSQAEFDDCAALDSATAGWYLNGTSTANSLDRCHAERCVGAAFDDVPWAALPGFLDCSATDCGINAPSTASMAVLGALTVGSRNGVAGVVHLGANLVVRPGADLTLQAGTLLKVGPGLRIQVQGRLSTTGSPGAPVWFTTETDDAVGGDTNNDGAATQPAPGAWRGLEFEQGSAGSTLRQARVAYGGWTASGRAVLIQDAVSLLDCAISGSEGYGIDLAMTDAPLRLERCYVLQCAADAMVRVHPHVLPSILDCEARYNGFNRIRTGDGFASFVTRDITVTARNCIQNQVYIGSNLTVAQGGRLQLDPGVIFKLAEFIQVTVQGSLDVRGDVGRGVVFTAEQDDSVGGDLNGDLNASRPAPGWWGQISIEGTATVNLRYFTVRYGGRGNYPMIQSLIALHPVSGALIAPYLSFFAVRADWGFNDGINLLSAPARFDRITGFRNGRRGFEITPTLSPLTRIPMRQITLVDNAVGPQHSGAYFDVKELIVVPTSVVPLFGHDCQVSYSIFPTCFGNNTNFPTDPQFVDQGAGDLRLRGGLGAAVHSWAIDHGDPTSPLDSDGTRADVGAYPFNWFPATTVCFQPGMNGCQPVTYYAGTASLSSEEAFDVSMYYGPSQSFGIFFYGPPTAPGTTTPYGLLCAGPSIVRTRPVPSGGTPLSDTCWGEFHFDVNEWLQGGNDPSVAPGDRLVGQFWFRDGLAPAGSKFSNAVGFTVRP